MPFSASDTTVSALKLFVWGAKLGAGGWVEIATAAADLISNVKALDKAIGDMGLTPLAKALDDIRADADRALRAGHGNGPHKVDDARAIFDQTALKAFPSSARLVDLGLDPDRVLAEMLATAKLDRDFRETAMAESYFALVLGPALKRLLNDAGYLAKLEPDFQRRVLANDAETQRKLDALLAAVTRPEGLSQDALLILARRINADVADPDTARRELERAVEIAANVIAEGLRGSNIDTIVDEVLKRIGRYTAEGRLPDARAVAAQALDEAREGAEKAKARHLRLLDTNVELGTLARDAQAVCDWLVEKVAVEHPNPATRLGLLRQVQHVWNQRGSSLGLRFDLEVSVRLAEICLEIAPTSYERCVAMDWLSNALLSLGEVESGSGRLENAVSACRAACFEWRSHNTPDDLAEATATLGVALRTLGMRQWGTENLEEAATLFRSLVAQWAPHRIPVDWSSNVQRTNIFAEAIWMKAKTNLGIVLAIMGGRQDSSEMLVEASSYLREALGNQQYLQVPFLHALALLSLGNARLRLGEQAGRSDWLDEARSAYNDALCIWTRKESPINWAELKNSIGCALFALGKLGFGDTHFRDARASFEEALEVWTRDRVPLNWANATGSLSLVNLALAERTNDFPLARGALANLILAEQILRDGGHIPWADTFARDIPTARALVERLTS